MGNNPKPRSGGTVATQCTSTRDLLLSGTVNLHRAYLNAGVDAHLVVFDALTHAFWYDPMLPEAQEANHIMAEFFVRELGK